MPSTHPPTPSLSTWTSPASEALVSLLKQVRRIGVVGCSSNPSRPSHSISRYLQEHGYEVVPINPVESEILGKRCHPDVASAVASEGPLDLVLIFRRSELAGAHVDEAIVAKADAVWLQTGIVDEAAALRAHTAGLTVVMDRCIMVEHRRLLGG